MKPATDVWAMNAQGDKRRFTRMSWDLLKTGKDGSKDGWRELPDTIIHNTVQNNNPVITKPITGNATKKDQVIDNTVTAKKDQVIENNVNTAQNNAGKDETKTVTNEQKAEFLKACDGLKKGDMKDFLDKQNPPVEYSNDAKDTKDKNYFPNLIGKHLNYNVVELQKAFN